MSDMTDREAYPGGLGGGNCPGCGVFIMEIWFGSADGQRLLDLDTLAHLLPWLRRDQVCDRLGSRAFFTGTVLSSCCTRNSSHREHIFHFTDDLADTWPQGVGASLSSPLAGNAGGIVCGKLCPAESLVDWIWENALKSCALVSARSFLLNRL